MSPVPEASSRMKSLRERLGNTGLSIATAAPAKEQAIILSPATRTKTIKTTSNFEARYALGAEVMPSGHKWMFVRFATRKKDGLECVIKLRIKPHCFSSRYEEATWRRSTEYLLNMPDSPNIARIYEVLEDKKAIYIVMEKVNGMDLFEVLAQERLPVSHAREIIQQLLRAMDHLHSQKAIHKDLKLENIMIDSPPASPRSAYGESSGSLSPTSVKVVDFDTVDQWEPMSPRAVEVVGTDQYIAPEAYGGRYSPLSDIFAIGVISYKLLRGRFPFHAQLFDDQPGENWVGCPKMAEIRDKLKTSHVDFEHKIFETNPEATDLVKRMLSHSESKRPTASLALEHPWFAEMPGYTATAAGAAFYMGQLPAAPHDLTAIPENTLLPETAANVAVCSGQPPTAPHDFADMPGNTLSLETAADVGPCPDQPPTAPHDFANMPGNTLSPETAAGAGSYTDQPAYFPCDWPPGEPQLSVVERVDDVPDEKSLPWTPATHSVALRRGGTRVYHRPMKPCDEINIVTPKDTSNVATPRASFFCFSF